MPNFNDQHIHVTLISSQDIHTRLFPTRTIVSPVENVESNIFVPPHIHSHNQLEGLFKDDHPQYLNDERGIDLFNALITNIGLNGLQDALTISTNDTTLKCNPLILNFVGPASIDNLDPRKVNINIDTKLSSVGTGASIPKNEVDKEFFLRTLVGVDGVFVTETPDEIIIGATGNALLPYFREDITGVIGNTVTFSQPYEANFNKLNVYRNGLHLINDLSVPDIDRFTESFVDTIGIPIAVSTGEVITAIFEYDIPSATAVITGVSGSFLTVPNYVLGSNTLRVWKNGLLMNPSGLGGLQDFYTEASTTSILLGQAAIPTDIFFVEVLAQSPVFREDKDNIVGTNLPTTTPYTVGSDKVLVYRNGLLQFNSVTLGGAIDRYQEFNANNFTLEVASQSTDWWTILFRS